MSKRIQTRNPDFIKGVNFPLQTYAWSGTQWGSSLAAANGKRATDTSPMVITSQPPGASAKNDTSWQLTFGASHDCVFSLFNGKFFNTTSLFKIPENLGGIYRDSIGTGDQNIYEQVKIGDKGIQQIHYVVSKNTAKEGRDAETYGSDVDEARGIGMRIPLMAGGWGRTIGMRPTDPEPTEDDKKRRNDEEHKLARETWKYGPIDFRWDDRRGVWGSWNDLIADQNKQNLGTLVFDTNPDATCGFPYLKGKLDDVWKIVIDSVQNPTGVDKDTDKSGSVATHLRHNWTQKEGTTWRYAALNSAFKIHRSDQSTGKCGTEIFESSFIEILTPTFFHLDDTFDGPICFTGEDIKDSELVGCMKFDGAQWVPAVDFNACDKVGYELAVLFANDKVLADKIIEVCNMLLECIGKSTGKTDPDKTQGAGEKSAEAGAANTQAKAALDTVTGSGPGGTFVAGDSPGGELNINLTAGEAAALNESLAASKAAFEAAASAQDQAGIDIIDAGEAQAAADTAGQELGNTAAAADAAQKAADAANAKLAESPNDGSTKEAAAKANEANSKAQADKNTATKKFNDANDAAAKAKDTADASHEKAKEATKDAKEKSDQVKKDAKGDLPEDVEAAIDEANEKNSEADKAREDAGIGEEDDETTEEQIETAVGDAKKELSDAIDGVACEKIEDLMALGDAMGQALQKALTDMTTAVNEAMAETMVNINSALGATVGYDTETGTGGIEYQETEVPPACPVEAVGSGKVVPGVPQESEAPATTTDGGGGSSTGGSRTNPSGGSKADPPPGPGSIAGGPAGTPGGPIVPPPPPPSCPIITIKDPCGGFSTHGPGPGGTGSGTPGGTATPGAGDPGTEGGATSGGVNDGGQVFKPAGGNIVGLGGQNT